MNIRICLDSKGYKFKPQEKEIGDISKRISKKEYHLDLETISLLIGEKGHTWTPATFYNGKRNNESFKSMQLFALDFDDGISLVDIKNRAKKYRIPIAFIYETFSSENASKFRVVFAHCSIVKESLLAKYILQLLIEIFPECDRQCSDLSRMFFGGKKLLICNDNENNMCFNFNDLTFSCIEKLKDTHGKNYKRKIKTISEKTGVMLRNGFPYIKICNDNNDYGEKIENSGAFPIEESNYIIIRSAPKFSNIWYEIFFCKAYDNKKGKFRVIDKKKEKRELIRNFKFDDLYKKCELFKEFVDGTEWLHHDKLFGIALNLIQVKGGHEKFIEILISEKNEEYQSYRDKDWNFYLNYFEKMNYKAINCERFCSYYGECDETCSMISGNKLKRKEIIITRKKEYCSIQQAEKNLEENFISAQISEEKIIHILKGQTGLGKSTTYLKYLDNNSKPYIIAVPTNTLKNEIFERASSKGYKVMITPSLPEKLSVKIKDEIDKLYLIGAARDIKKEIKQLIKAEKDEEVLAEIDKYFEALERVYKFNGHIITTHARLLTFRKEMLSKFDIIIDEDILRTLIKIEKVKVKDLIRAMDITGIPDRTKDEISHIINDYGYKRICKFSYEFTAKDIRKIKKSDKFSSNVIDFLHAFVIYKDKKTDDENFLNSEIQYLVKRGLPKQKIIIMSATIDDMIYEEYFGKDEIRVYNCVEAKYKGNIKQYYDMTYSRNCLEENPKLYKKIEKNLRDIDIITFKSYKKFFTNGSELHFGNVEGHNCYEGKDIAIVGTPNLHESVYKLYGATLGIEVNNEELRYQQIEYGIFKFWLMTYNNPLLRRIQLWLIKSELEQSVGRARILRNDCNVFLFSNFPVEQAELNSKT